MISKAVYPRVNPWLVSGLWALFGLWVGNQTFFEMQSRGMHHIYGRIMLWAIARAEVWALATPLILALTFRFPIEGPRKAIPILTQLLAGAAAILLFVLAETAILIWVEPFYPIAVKAPFFVQFRDGLSVNLFSRILEYGIIVGIGHAMLYRHRERQRQLESARLETLLAQAQMQALKGQVQPHFLFNSLNGIVSLIRENRNDSAERMLLGLSDLLRHALDSSEQQTVSLGEEMEFVKQYAEIERMRFPDRLTFRENIDERLKRARVPSLILQPLVENAIRHGAANQIGNTCVEVHAAVDDGSLRITVADDGAGLQDGFAAGQSTGIGLRNTMERLRHLYGERQSLTLRPGPSGGAVATISIPFEQQEEGCA